MPTPRTRRLRCRHSRLDPLHSAIAEPNQLGHAINAEAVAQASTIWVAPWLGVRALRSGGPCLRRLASLRDDHITTRAEPIIKSRCCCSLARGADPFLKDRVLA
jgi:hypothetical protein